MVPVLLLRILPLLVVIERLLIKETQNIKTDHGYSNWSRFVVSMAMTCDNIHDTGKMLNSKDMAIIGYLPFFFFFSILKKKHNILFGYSISLVRKTFFQNSLAPLYKMFQR